MNRQPLHTQTINTPASHNWCYPAIVAHRGGGSLAPENTLAAIDTGARCGHRMFECDVKLSRDGQLFLLHDDTLDRTSNGHGIAGEQRWQDLRKLDAGSWFADTFSGEPLPLLSQVADRCRQHQLLVNIEIKPSPGSDTVTGEAVALAARQWWRDMPAPLLSSFSVAALQAAQRAAPELPRGLLLHHWRDDWRQLTSQLTCLSLHLNHELLNPPRIAAIKAAGLPILAYTVNQPSRAAELLRMGVDCVCTDRIDLIGADFHG